MGIFLRKSMKLGKHTRINLSKSGFGISTGVKGTRIGVNSKGKTYVSGGKDGVYFRKQLGNSNNSSKNKVYTAEEIKADRKLLHEYNHNVVKGAINKLVKTYFILNLISVVVDAIFIKNSIVIYGIMSLLIVWFIGTAIYLYWKMFNANKLNRLVNESLN